MVWFTKAKEDGGKSPEDQAAEMQQGNYTDYTGSPYEIRQQIAPLYGDELEAFTWVLNTKYKKIKSQSDAIDQALSDGWFVEGPQGELRVSKDSGKKS